MSARVAVVVVSHSDLLARGVAELVAQMAPDVAVLTAGGTDALGLGTSFDRVERAVESALESVGGEAAPDGAGVVVLTDLGSATMTVESVLEMVDQPDRVVFADAPLVEGAVAASVRAQLGDSVEEVARAAIGAAQGFLGVSVDAQSTSGTVQHSDSVPVVRARAEAEPPQTAAAQARVADPVGLHARPAALLARLAGTFESESTVNGADAGSVLELMSLGVRQGDQVEVSATGPDARAAVAALVAMLEGDQQEPPSGGSAGS